MRSEIKADALKNYVDAYEAEKSIIKKFHEYLKKAVDELIKIGGKNKIIIFIDELDSRP